MKKYLVNTVNLLLDQLWNFNIKQHNNWMWDHDYYYFETIQNNYGIKKGLLRNSCHAASVTAVVTVVLFDSLKELADTKVQFLQNRLQPQTDVMRWDQRPQENGEHCGGGVYSQTPRRTLNQLPCCSVRTHEQTLCPRNSPRTYEMTIPGM